MSDSRSFVVQLWDGRETFVDTQDYKGKATTYGDVLDNVMAEVIRRLELTTTRKNPEKLKGTKIYELEICKGKIKRSLVSSLRDFTLPLARMTKTEYDEEMQEICSHFPTDFGCFIASEAWDRGHSAGYEEVVNIAQDLKDKLWPIVKNYALRPGVK